MDYVNKVAVSVLYAMTFVVVFTSIMTFIDVEPQTYNPFMYFMLLLLLFYLFLSWTIFSRSSSCTSTTTFRYTSTGSCRLPYAMVVRPLCICLHLFWSHTLNGFIWSSTRFQASLLKLGYSNRRASTFGQVVLSDPSRIHMFNFHFCSHTSCLHRELHTFNV